MKRVASCAGMAVALMALGACGPHPPPPALETIATHAVEFSVHCQGELKPTHATQLSVPGKDWEPRRLVWMLPEGSAVRKGDLLARFSSAQGKLQLGQAEIDLERNALARTANTESLRSSQERLDVDLSKVAVDLDIAERYAHADVSTLARNDVLDAVQDVRFLDTKRDTLQWRRAQSSQRGRAELAVLDAQRATFDLTAQQRRADLDALELRAPNAGVLMLTASWSGQKPAVGANLNASEDFGSLPDPSAMQAELALPQVQAQGVRIGDRVELHPAGHPEQTMHSTINWIASVANVRSNQSPVKYLSLRAAIPPAAIQAFGLVPGQAVEADIVLLRGAHARSVPNLALRGDNDHSFVEVRDGDGFRRQPVRIGVRGPARSQVLAGLQDGDQVLVTRAPAATTDASAADASAAKPAADIAPAGAMP